MSLASDIAAIVDRAYRNAVPGQSVTRQINASIDTYLRNGGAVGEAKKELRRQAKAMANEYLATRDALKGVEFATRFGPQAEDVARINALIAPDVERAESRMERQASKILGRVGRLVELAAKTGAPLRSLVARARALAGRADRGLKAELDTATAAFDRTARMRGATDAGVTTFRYAGPTVNLRPFCAATMERNGGIYSLDEIRKMDNGQGLPVETHCGGYNCRHRWVPYASAIEGWEVGHAAAFESVAGDLAAFTAQTGYTMDPAKMAKAFRVDVAGYGNRNTSVLVTQEPTIRIASEVVDSRGHYVGDWQRQIEIGSEGELVVYNKYMRFDPAHRGRGLAASMWAAVVPWCDEVGVKRIRVYAALETGHMLWMRYGYEFADTPQRSAEQTRRRWQELYAEVIADRLQIKTETAERYVRNLREPHEFDALVVRGRRGTINGREVKLALEGLTWAGTLNMDKGATSRKVLDAYLAKKRK